MTDLPYAAAKAGLNTLTVGFAVTFGPTVRSNGIMVGPFLTDISKAWDVDAFRSTPGGGSRCSASASRRRSSAPPCTSRPTRRASRPAACSPSTAACRCRPVHVEVGLNVDVGLSVYDIAGGELVALGAAAEAGRLLDAVARRARRAAGRLPRRAPDDRLDRPTRSHLQRIIDPATKLLDPLVALGAVAAVTDRIRLATGIYLVRLRHPLAVARMTLTLQDVAGGRFMLGVGSGWLEEEFAALGVPFGERRARFDEALAVLRAAWAAASSSFAGRTVAFEHVMVTAEPGARAAGPRRQHRAGAAPGGRAWPTAGSARATRRSTRRCACATGCRAGRRGRRDRPLPIYVRMAGRDPAELAATPITASST